MAQLIRNVCSYLKSGHSKCDLFLIQVLTVTSRFFTLGPNDVTIRR
jgi:hypothetical protein